MFSRCFDPMTRAASFLLLTAALAGGLGYWPSRDPGATDYTREQNQRLLWGPRRDR